MEVGNIIETGTSVVISDKDIDNFTRQVKELTGQTLRTKRSISVLDANLDMLSREHREYREQRDNVVDKMQRVSEELKL